MKLHVLVFLLSVISVSVAAQQEPAAILIDEFERVPCDDFRARLDNFHNRLVAMPDASAYVVTFGETNNMRANVFHEGMIKGYFIQRKLGLGQPKFIHTHFRPKLMFQFWIVPAGGKLADVSTVKWNYTLPAMTGPFMFDWEYSFDDGICPPVNGYVLYKDFLAANPGAIGNVVIRESTYRSFVRQRTAVSSILTKEYGIPARQLRFFFSRELNSQKLNTSILPVVEYWIVPSRTR